MRSLLENLEKDGWLKKQEIALSQIERLARRAFEDLETAKRNLDLDPECAYDYSYKGMLRIGRALLFTYSYRPRSERSHKTVVEACGIVLGERFKELVDIFDRMRKVRNQFTYEPKGEISQKEAEEALKEGKQFLDIVIKRIKEINPQLSLF